MDHIAKHDVKPSEAEYVVRHAASPFPREIADEKYKVWGQTTDGRYLQVIFAYRSEDEVAYDSLTLIDILAVESGEGPIVYVIHAMDLTLNMKHQYRRLME